ncbi:MAG: type I DNA topoisomerase [Planctomycetes bacterium]|nr:type I DNA topoisomerase [Planctomycetota bacterium]
MTAKKLVIVESPAKAKTINKYLGNEYVVKASMGHVRDLPKGKLGIDVEHDFQPDYLVIRTRGDVIKDLKKLAKSSSAVYLAPDPDREGEAIAWHLKEALALEDDTTFRVTFNEITKRAVQEAIEKPGRVRMSLVDAQQTRRILDRLVGYKLSPLLWDKIARGLSAGRVQSAAVRLIVEREREIRAFKPQEYWKIIAELKKHDDAVGAKNPKSSTFTAELKRKDDKALEIDNEKDAQAAFDAIQKATWSVTSVEQKRKSVKAAPPLSTSLLQQQASVRLRYSAKKTMMIAQQLYEGVEVGAEGSVGLITYMRTDSYRLSNDAIGATRQFIEQQFGKKYLPEKANLFAARKGAQEAHEAIRPTDITRTPDAVAQYLNKDQLRLYTLIWERVVACQMANAEFDQTSVSIAAGAYTFSARGRTLVFDGFLRLTGFEKSEDEQVLPPLVANDPLDLVNLAKSQHFTQPPQRYSEASLVKTLEKNGIGRPSTYASIISTIQDRGYVKLAERKFFATELGEVVNDSLVKHFPEIVDLEFTAGLESKLDEIEAAPEKESSGKSLGLMKSFYATLESDLGKAKVDMKNLKAVEVEGEKCPQCGKPMLLRMNRFGRFKGCSGYPECKYIERTSADGTPAAPSAPPEPTDEVCEKCGKPMVIRNGKRGRFMSCSGWPKCKNTCSVDAEGKPIRPMLVDVACEKCQAPKMVVRFSKRGPFLGCSRYPKCRGTKPLPPELKDKVKPPPKAAPVPDADGASEGADEPAPATDDGGGADD